MHFAAYAYVGESMREPGRYFGNNVASTSSCSRRCDAGLNRSCSRPPAPTYGVPASGCRSRRARAAPHQPVRRVKLFVERMLHWCGVAHGLRSVALRYFNAAGADPDGEIGEDHDPETHLIPLAIGAGARKRPPLEIYGTDYPTPDGTAVRDYVHVSDLADAHVLRARLSGAGGESRAFNLGTGRGHSVREVIAAVERTGKRDVPRRAAARRPGDPASLVAAPNAAASCSAGRRGAPIWTPSSPPRGAGTPADRLGGPPMAGIAARPRVAGKFCTPAMRSSGSGRNLRHFPSDAVYVKGRPTLAPRRGAAPRPARHGRPALGAARRLPRHARPRRRIEARVREGVRACAGHPALLGYASATRSRPRSCAGTAGGDRALPAAALRGGEGGGPRRARHVRQLSRPPSTSSCRSSTSSASTSTSNRAQALRGVPRPPAEPGRRPAAGDGRDRPRQPPQRRGRAGRSSTGRCAARSPPAAPGPSSSPGPTSGTAAASTSRTGTSVSPTAIAAPSPRCAAVREAPTRRSLSRDDLPWPRISVVVCSYNGARTMRDCLDGLKRLDYPDFEVIVVDDGSTDATAAIAAEYGVRLISTENRGLSSARNTGWHAATGEIVAYIDDDAYPDPHWLHYLATRSCRTDTSASAGRTSRPPATARSPSASPTRRAARSTCSSRRRGRAHPRLQHGLPPRRARGDRRLRSALPRRRRRRRPVLAAAGARRQDRLHAGAMVWHHRRNSVACTGASRRATARPRRCSSRSGRSATTRPGHLAGRGALRTRASRCPTCARLASTAACGDRRRTSRSTSRRRTRCSRCR